MRAAETVEIPVTYDGEDLDDVARLMDLSTVEVIAAHQAALWQVAFCGFAPGFAYMTGDDPRFDLPRREAPRQVIPAGSVALAGRFCGIYPQASPGGWQLIGRTRLAMFDLSRAPAALLRPGMPARFVPGEAEVHPVAAAGARGAGAARPADRLPDPGAGHGPGGAGGAGGQRLGGAGLGALRRANRAVGNPPGAAALEITLGPVRLRAETALTLALAGAGQAVAAGYPVPPVPPSRWMRGMSC